MSAERRFVEGDPSSSPSPARRKPYCAPRLGRVSLEADQVLGVGCKTQSQMGNTSNPPLGGYCGYSPCSTWGS